MDTPKWANPSTETIPASQVYRDADTLGRLLELIGATERAVLAADEVKTTAMASMTTEGTHVAQQPDSSRATAVVDGSEWDHGSAIDFTIGGLQQSGFVGFVPVASLGEGRLADIPRLPGVYVVIRADSSAPVFLVRSTGGHFKGKGPHCLDRSPSAQLGPPGVGAVHWAYWWGAAQEDQDPARLRRWATGWALGRSAHLAAR